MRDNGLGFDEHDHASVFDRFGQVGGTLTDKPQGSDRGLHISRRVIEYFGGTMWVESSRRKGASFSFTLPIAATAASDDA